ncbi:hypothetical protein ABW19_dt0206110 [Dactylella cylindrospora]|nr:hypothetical protein ABW19_dt0206110 [Dactylella cylindrospora]
MGLASIAGTIATTIAGIASLNLFILGAASTGAFTKPVGRKKKEDRLQARSELWDLSQQPLPGFYHKFFKGQDGFELHYVEGGNTDPDSPLVIFIHGFPDSWFIWHYQLESPSLQQKAHVIAIDLPGYGGSDVFPVATATNILTSIANFIVARKERKTNEKCILVTHDWGSVVGFRLASEPALIVENADRATSSASKMLRTFIRRPTNFALLRSAYRNLKPLLTQLRCSYYISVFLLPRPLARLLVKMGDFWFPRICARFAKVRSEEIYLASVRGPSKAEAEGYPASVMARDNVNVRINGMIAYYRDGLAWDKWNKPENLQLLTAADEAAGSGFTGLMERKVGAMQCPVSIIWCGRDGAFHKPFCYEGLEDYLRPSKGGKGKSYLLCFPKSTHWPMVPSPGREAIDMLIESELDDIEGEDMKERLWAVDKDIKFDVEK